MMISPDVYYDYHLRGKPEKAIMSEIRSLKREISGLKSALEYPFPLEDEYPSASTKLHLTQQYLEKSQRSIIRVRRCLHAYESRG